MPTATIDVQELPSRIAEIVSLASAGTEIIVTEGNVPRAKLIPLPPGHVRVPDLHPGAFTMADDFDAPLSEDSWADGP